LPAFALSAQHGPIYQQTHHSRPIVPFLEPSPLLATWAVLGRAGENYRRLVTAASDYRPGTMAQLTLVKLSQAERIRDSRATIRAPDSNSGR
jgi:hypothetical protein